jgi:membrane fusion protein (multidrug efflux system)
MASPLSRVSRPWLLVAGAALVAVVGFVAWRYLSPSVSTDDAQVAGHVSAISARVGGSIKAVHVEDNQAVKANDILIEIDPRDYELAVGARRKPTSPPRKPRRRPRKATSP